MSSEKLEIGLDDLEDYARGAAFLGTGGGGDPYLGKLAVSEELRKGGSINIVEVDELGDDQTVVKVGSVGSPSVGLEKLMSARIATRALRELEAHVGKKIDAVISGEIGGNNATIPLIVAAQTGLPVVNGDGMGRAFPKMNMSAFSLFGATAAPCVVLNNAGDKSILEIEDNSKMERAVRSLTTSMGGGRVTAASFMMTGKKLRECVIPRTLTLALEIGRAIGSSHDNGLRPIQALEEYFSKNLKDRFVGEIFSGKIVDVKRDVQGGFTVGEVVIKRMETGGPDVRDYGESCHISFQNENLVAEVDGEIVATVPDLITIIDHETGDPITTETLKYGQRVDVIGMSCDPLYRTEKALEICSARSFGIDTDYIPIEERLECGTAFKSQGVADAY